MQAVVGSIVSLSRHLSLKQSTSFGSNDLFLTQLYELYSSLKIIKFYTPITLYTLWNMIVKSNMSGPLN